ncbi:MAG: amino acid permease [Planctomycetales bacterium]|nr:amino acid permease [Planctomycetales bacterium]
MPESETTPVARGDQPIASERWTRQFGLTTGLLLVVANMIGTGVFTTTGFLVRDIASIPAVLVAWCLGGLVALCGAMTYAELSRTYPNNGGEYQLLTRIYHPAIGFLSGCASFVVGFSAPIAASAMAFGDYLNGVFPEFPNRPAAVGLVVVLAFLQSKWPLLGSRFQNIFTLGKIGLILTFIVGGLSLADWSHLAQPSDVSMTAAITSPAFAVGLVYISFTYAGWNAAAYVAGELRNPSRTVPLALIGGTSIVMLLYLGLNVVFLASAPVDQLAGQLRIGHVAAVSLFGDAAGRGMSLLIAVGLVSSVGAMMIGGPRVYEAIGLDYPALAVLSKRSADGSPIIAVVLQAVVTIGLIFLMKFDELLRFIGVTLSIFAGLTVLGVFVVRRRIRSQATAGVAFLKALPPLLFIALESWMIWHAVRSDPRVLFATGLVLAAAFGLYLIVGRSISPTAVTSDLRTTADE